MKKTNKKTKFSDKKGFTLVELLLVIAIIGILAAVLFVSLGKQRERARKTAFKETIRSMASVATSCTDAGGYIRGGRMDVDPGGYFCYNGTAGSARVDFGRRPTVTDCDGENTDNRVNISPIGGYLSDYAYGANWAFRAYCYLGDGDRCWVNCDINGCVYCNNGLNKDANGRWTNCLDDSNCK